MKNLALYLYSICWVVCYIFAIATICLRVWQTGMAPPHLSDFEVLGLAVLLMTFLLPAFLIAPGLASYGAVYAPYEADAE